MDDDRRAVLEGIAYGSDPKLTPGDRLKALELLKDLDIEAGTAAEAADALSLAREVVELSGAELDRQLAGYFEPGYVGVVEQETRIEHRARQLADTDTIDAEVQRRATAMAHIMVQRGQAQATPAPQADAAAPRDVEADPGPSPVIEGPQTTPTERRLLEQYLEGPGLFPDEIPEARRRLWRARNGLG